jgi:hypothetical protein
MRNNVAEMHSKQQIVLDVMHNRITNALDEMHNRTQIADEEKLERMLPKKDVMHFRIRPKLERIYKTGIVISYVI